MKKYLVIIEKTGTGYSAYVPDLPGCIATGPSRDKVTINIYEAIKLHLEGLREEGEEIPEARSEAEMLILAV